LADFFPDFLADFLLFLLAVAIVLLPGG